MPRMMNVPLPPMEVKAVAPATGRGDNELALKRRLLREAIDDSRWKHDAVAAALGVDAPYLSKMLAGEKPITLRHLDALPDDVEATYAKKYAEGFGLIVVAPAASPECAIQQLVSGLVGVLTAKKAVA